MNDEDLDYAEARDKFVAETRRDLQANLSRHNLWKEADPLTLRIVSSATLYDFIKYSEERDIELEAGNSLAAEERKGGKKRTEYIDEPGLFYDLLKKAHERRGSGDTSRVLVSTITSYGGLSRLGKGVSSNL